MANLAARCTACGTAFRVVPDQLRVAAGMVRCGRCSQVFNANESLIDLDSFAAPLPVPPVPVPVPVPVPPVPIPEAPAMPSPADFVDPASEPANEQASEPGTEFELMLPLGAHTPRAAAPLTSESDLPAAPTEGPPALQPWSGGELHFDEPRLSPEADAGLAADRAAVNDPMPAARTAEPEAVEPEAAEPEAVSAPAAVPSFIRQADSAQRWRSPRARAWMGAGVAAGLLLLAGQYAFNFRDTLVARNPGMRAVLEPSCAALGCRIEAPRLIEQLAVESSGLVRVEKSAVYKLQVALRNRDTISLAMPALDVTLSDAQGKPLARRVMRMSELGVTDTTLAAGRELSVQATLQAAFTPTSTAVVGYTIELFYP